MQQARDNFTKSMLIYFDESYDRAHRYLLLGTLYVPDSRRVHKRLQALKAQHRASAPGHTFRDLKYARSGDRYISAACRDAVNVFVESNAYFRAIVIDTSLPGFTWDYFGNPSEPPPLKRARAYNKFAERLLRFNIGSIKNAVLLADSLTRVPGDNFAEFLALSFGSSMRADSWTLEPGELRHVQEVNTRLEQYQVGQVCDILLGAVLGDLVPPRNANKLALIDHVKLSVGVPSFGPTFWARFPKYVLDVTFPKFQVWHWRPNP